MSIDCADQDAFDIRCVVLVSDEPADSPGSLATSLREMGVGVVLVSSPAALVAEIGLLAIEARLARKRHQRIFSGDEAETDLDEAGELETHNLIACIVRGEWQPRADLAQAIETIARYFPHVARLRFDPASTPMLVPMTVSPATESPQLADEPGGEDRGGGGGEVEAAEMQGPNEESADSPEMRRAHSESSAGGGSGESGEHAAEAENPDIADATADPRTAPAKPVPAVIFADDADDEETPADPATVAGAILRSAADSTVAPASSSGDPALYEQRSTTPAALRLVETDEEAHQRWAAGAGSHASDDHAEELVSRAELAMLLNTDDQDRQDGRDDPEADLDQ